MHGLNIACQLLRMFLLLNELKMSSSILQCLNKEKSSALVPLAMKKCAISAKALPL
jgi:hypothetical protein